MVSQEQGLGSVAYCAALLLKKFNGLVFLLMIFNIAVMLVQHGIT